MSAVGPHAHSLKPAAWWAPWASARAVGRHSSPGCTTDVDAAIDCYGAFVVDRPSYRSAAATDGWVRVTGFLGRHLIS